MIFRVVASKLLPWLELTNHRHSISLSLPRKEDLSYQTIVEYLHALAKIYFISNRKRKSQLLNDAAQLTGMHRKSLTRSLGQADIKIKSKKNNCGTNTLYPEELLITHIKYLWEQMERISAKRMKAALPEWLPYYHQNEITNHQKFLLNKMSFSTLDRFLKKLRHNYYSSGKGLCSTSPARHMKNKVPINTLDSTITRPGYVQGDTVAHCGDKLIGEFMNSITLTDINSTWTQNQAIFTKTAIEVKDALKSMQKEMPFTLLAVNTDSGSEFLNVPVFNHFQQQKVVFTRSRPYKKNDNCYVEQKNFTHVRELFGYQRIEHEELKDLMNEIYHFHWNPLQNYFMPTFKLKDKIRVGSKVKKIYGRPLTPYQRLMESTHLTESQKCQLSDRRKTFNPFELKNGLEKKLTTFFSLLERYNKERKEKQ